MAVIPKHYEGSSKREKVEHMFDSIATKYDLLNHVLSAGIDKTWRKKLISILSKENPKIILDVATGTADLAIAAASLQPHEIIGVDISYRMLEVGRNKIKAKKLESLIQLIHADSEQLPFEANSFDAITVAFGVRNYEHLLTGLKEMYRVLKPGGICLILEFSQPQSFPVKQFYKFYSKYILPFAGQLLSKQRSAYEYLPESVNAFPHGEKFLNIFNDAGFNNTKYLSLTFGIASIYEGRKEKL